MSRYASKTDHLQIMTLYFGGISWIKSFHRNVLTVAVLPGGHSFYPFLYHAISATMTDSACFLSLPTSLPVSLRKTQATVSIVTSTILTGVWPKR